MIKFKLISNFTERNDPSLSLLRLPPEQLEYLLAFCDMTSLLKVRRTNSRLLKLANRGLAERFQVSWRYCLQSNIPPLALTHYYPTQYFSHLTVPLLACSFALKVMKFHNLNPSMVQSFLELHPEGNISLPLGVYEVSGTLACMLDDESVILWERKGLSYESQVVSKVLLPTNLYSRKDKKLFFIPKHERSVLDVTILEMHAGFAEKLMGRTVKRYFKSPFRPTMSLIAKLDDGDVLFMTHHSGGCVRLPYVPTDRTVQSIYFLDTQYYLVLLDNGSVFCLTAEGSDTQKSSLRLTEGQDDLKKLRVSLVASWEYIFNMVLDDLRTVVQYGFLNSRKKMSLRSFQFSEQSKIKDVYTNRFASVALFCNGKMAVWGNETYGGTMPSLPENYYICSIHQSEFAFAALLQGGKVIPWGAYNNGGQMTSLPCDRSVKSIFSNNSSFVALLDDQTMHVWGNRRLGGQLPEELKGCAVQTVFSNNYAYMAMLEDGRLCYWGCKCISGQMIQIPKGRKVVAVLPSDVTFVIMLDNGDLIPIGTPGTLYSDSDDFSQTVLPMPKGKKMAVIDSDNHF